MFNLFFKFVLTSDKGLAGSYNANIIKETLSTIKDYQDKNITESTFLEILETEYNKIERQKTKETNNINKES